MSWYLSTKILYEDLSIGIDYLFWFLIALISIPGIYGSFWFAPGVVWSIYTIAILYNVVAARFVLPFLIFYFYLLLFSFYATPTIFFGYDLVEMDNRIALDYLSRCFCLLLFFIATVNFFIKPHMYRNFRSGSFFEVLENFKPLQNMVVFIVLKITVILALIFLIDGVLLIGHNATYQNYINNLKSSSGAPEYTLVILLLLRFSSNTKIRKIIFWIILCCFVAKTSLLGFRIVGATGILMAISVTNSRFMRKHAFLVLIGGFLITAYLGLAKSGITLSIDTVMLLFIEVHDGKLVSHHGNVLWASAETLQAIEIGVINSEMRLSSLLFHLLNTLIPSGLLRSFNLPSLGVLLQQKQITSGGGLWLVFAFVDFGLFGVIIVTFWPIYLFKHLLRCRLTSNSHRIISTLGVMVIILSLRWVSYDFGNFLFRLPLYTAILMSLMVALTKVGARRENSFR